MAAKPTLVFSRLHVIIHAIHDDMEGVFEGGSRSNGKVFVPCPCTLLYRKKYRAADVGL